MATCRSGPHDAAGGESTGSPSLGRRARKGPVLAGRRRSMATQPPRATPGRRSRSSGRRRPRATSAARAATASTTPSATSTGTTHPGRLSGSPGAAAAVAGSTAGATVGAAARAAASMGRRGRGAGSARSRPVDRRCDLRRPLPDRAERERVGRERDRQVDRAIRARAVHPDLQPARPTGRHLEVEQVVAVGLRALGRGAGRRAVPPGEDQGDRRSDHGDHLAVRAVRRRDGHPDQQDRSGWRVERDGGVQGRLEELLARDGPRAERDEEPRDSQDGRRRGAGGAGNDGFDIGDSCGR